MPKEVPIDLLNNSVKEVVYKRKKSYLYKKYLKKIKKENQTNKELGKIYNNNVKPHFNKREIDSKLSLKII